MSTNDNDSFLNTFFDFMFYQNWNARMLTFLLGGKTSIIRRLDELMFNEG